MRFKIKKNKLDNIIFKYLWIIILLPKTMQFFVYIAAFGLCIITHRVFIKMDRQSICFIGMAIIQIIAICNQYMTNIPDSERLAAAINTSLIWIISVLYYIYFKNKIYTKEDVNKIIKYLIVDLGILFVIYIFSIFLHKNVYSILGYNFVIKRFDYLATGTTTRFCGGMETVLGPSHLFCLAFPMCMFAVKLIKKSKKIILAVGIGSYIAVIATHSRTGLLICSGIILIALLYYASNMKIIRKYNKLIIFAIVIVTICVAGLNIQSIIEKLTVLLNSRVGSNNARFAIYYNSVYKTLKESPIIGIGIKYMLGNFPYGSHCTYIGIFYKTGILGAILFVSGMILMIKRLWHNCRQSSLSKTVFFMLIMYFGMMIFSDVDGSDWVIILFFSIFGMLSSKENKFIRTLME